MRSRFACLFAGAALCASSCSGADPDHPAVGEPFTVWVFEERLTLADDDRPLGGVRVAFDPPGGGERVVTRTAPDGHVAFEGDFARGSATVTVLSDEHVYTTVLEASPDAARARPNALGKPPADLVIFPPRFDTLTERSTVELRGTITGKRDPGNVVSVAVSALARLGSYEGVGPSYVLRAPKGRPFFLLGHETRPVLDDRGVIVDSQLLGSFRLELPERTDDQLLDLDLAGLPRLPTKLLHVRADKPTDVPSPFGPGTRAYASVGSIDSALTVAPFARSQESADGLAFELAATLVETDVAPERLISQVELVAPDGSRSIRREQGIMVDGTTWGDFAVPPAIREPDASRAATDPIPLDGFPPGADLVARVYAGGRLLWILHGRPGGPHADAFTIPYRGEVGDVDVQVFALSLTACTGRVDLPPRGALYRSCSTLRDIQLRKR